MRRASLGAVVVVGLIALGAFVWSSAEDPAAPAASTARPVSETLDPMPEAPVGDQIAANPGAPSAVRPAAEGGTPPLDRPAVQSEGVAEVVVTVRDVPIAGAQIRLYWRGPIDPNTNQVDWRLAGSGATGPDGVARLAARPGAYLVTARASGFAPGRREVARPQGEPTTRVGISLQPGSTLLGATVARGRREPVPLAQLVVIEEIGSGTRHRPPDIPGEEQVVAASDTRGRFRIEGLAPGNYRVDAQAAGFARSTAREVAVPRSQDLVVEMGAAGFLEGFVYAADSSPASGAEVTAVGAEQPPVAVAGPAGGFSIEVPAGSFQVAARCGAETGALPAPVQVAPGATVRGLAIRLGAGCAIQGTVVADPSSEAIAGAAIAVSPYLQNGDSGRAVTDANGAFLVAGLAPGSYDVVASAPGSADALRRGVTLVAGQRFPMTIKLQGTGGVEGAVRDSDGRTLAGVRVVARYAWREASLGPAPGEAVTDEHGRYGLSPLAPGKVQVFARRDEAWSPPQVIKVPAGGTVRADFVLAWSGVLIGLVATRNGGVPDRPSQVGAWPVGMRAWPGEMSPRAPVDATGRYRLVLHPGRYNVGAVPVSNPGGFWRAAANVPVEIAAGRESRADLILADGESATVAGIVVEPGGGPSAGARVTAGYDRTVSFGTRADQEGRFEVLLARRAAPAPVTVWARSGGRFAQVGGVAADTRGLVVQLKASGSIRGRVAGSNGVPVDGFRVWAASAIPGGLEFVGDRFDLVEVPADRVKVSVHTHDGRSGSTDVAPAPGGVTEVEIAVK